MTTPESPYEAPHADVPSSPKASRGVWIFRGCATVLVLGLVMVGSCFAFWKHGADSSERELGPVVDRYLARIDAGDYHGAYADFGQTMHESTKEDAYVSLDTGVHQRLGRLNSKTLESWARGTDTKGSWARVAYRCEFEKGPGTLRLQFRSEGGQWKIIAFSYGGPLIDEAFRSALSVHDGGS